MTADDTGVPPEADVVRSFLQRYYFDEEWEDEAAIRALQAHTDDEDRQERWRVAHAFDRLLGAELPAGFLQQLVVASANRDVLTDAEAREFLGRVYESNAFDVAVNFDDLE